MPSKSAALPLKVFETSNIYQICIAQTVASYSYIEHELHYLEI